VSHPLCRKSGRPGSNIRRTRNWRSFLRAARRARSGRRIKEVEIKRPQRARRRLNRGNLWGRGYYKGRGREGRTAIVGGTKKTKNPGDALSCSRTGKGKSGAKCMALRKLRAWQEQPWRLLHGGKGALALGDMDPI